MFGLIGVTLLTLMVIPRGLAKEQVVVRPFMFDDCSDHPIAKEVPLTMGKCEIVQARGLKLEAHKNDKYTRGWLPQVNSGKLECIITTFTNRYCGGEGEEFVVPNSFKHCVTAGSEEAIHSALFSCKPSRRIFAREYNITQTMELPSYSIDDSGNVHESYFTGTFTALRYVNPTPLTTIHAESSATPDLETRETYHNRKAVWLKHPWQPDQLLCYRCWTKHKDDYTKWKCHHGPKVPEDCGDEPVVPPQKIVTSVTATKTITHSYFTVTWPPDPKEDKLDLREEPLEERNSLHKPVQLTNPFMSSRHVCADAEYEKQYKQNWEVRIQKPKACGSDDSKGRLNVDIPSAKTRTSAIATNTITKTLGL